MKIFCGLKFKNTLLLESTNNTALHPLLWLIVKAQHDLIPHNSKAKINSDD